MTRYNNYGDIGALLTVAIAMVMLTNFVKTLHSFSNQTSANLCMHGVRQYHYGDTGILLTIAIVILTIFVKNILAF